MTTPTDLSHRSSIDRILDVDKEYNMLSLRDLLDARDLYHLHLMARQHVVGTAVGRYLIRKDDPWPRDRQDLVRYDTAQLRKKRRDPRTLGDSEVRPYSWPCVLVMVDQWIDEADAAKQGLQPSDLVPRALLMPDGSKVPVCVVYAPVQESAPPPGFPTHFPDQLIGGGYPILLDVQGLEHFASVGCLVTDGHLIYALTNRHVAGPAGQPVYTILKGEKVRIGQTAEPHLTRKLFSEVYRGWPGKDVFVNLDVGLVTIDDQNQWTAQIYGKGTMGKLADLSTANITLRLIDCPVSAYGAASGPLQGALKGLFYRYKSLGGFEYVADCLIGPRTKGDVLQTRVGDSGTLWLAETGDPERGDLPLALQWGAQRFLAGGTSMESPYVLATFLSTVCSELEVDVVRDWNIGTLNYWGAVGHYTIATLACEKVTVPRLKAIMEANVERISFAAAQISKKTVSGLSKHDFVPLADVPDLVWKIAKKAKGGRGQPEHPGHFADMDAKDPGDRTLLDICREDPDGVTVARWQQYYDEVEDESRGLLPFRVWQFWDAMVDFAKHGHPAKFVCAAGTLAHYVGDACQPLHISRMHDGDPADTHDVMKRNRHTGKMELVTVPRASGVHTAYENDMVNYHVTEIIEALRSDAEELPAAVTSGQEAARAVVALMQRTFDAIEPKDIVVEYQKHLDLEDTPKPTADALWQEFGTRTCRNMADGARTLAMLWESAWREGGGASAEEGNEHAFPETMLDGLYRNQEFVPSLVLDKVGAVLVQPEHV
jgi:hypothetical protein